jgi:hypothetical protein
MLLVASSPAASTETLKNFVLPGTGSFCIVDDHATVEQQDVASNFSVPAAAAAIGGNSLAQEVTSQYLQEWNPDVQGSFQHSNTKLSSITDGKVTVFDKNNAANKKKALVIVASDLDGIAEPSL